MPWTDAFAPAEAKYREDVMRSTWGHLAPRENKSYRGYMTFAIGCYDHGSSNPTPLKVQFKGLEDSPWLYEFVHETLQAWQNGRGRRRRKKERFAVGHVYLFDGMFRNYKLIGKIKRIL